ncbi:hypothetical protein QUC31_003655 [Theobroma cacao]
MKQWPFPSILSLPEPSSLWKESLISATQSAFGIPCVRKEARLSSMIMSLNWDEYMPNPNNRLESALVKPIVSRSSILCSSTLLNH